MTTLNYWEMPDSSLAAEWRSVDAENYLNDYAGEAAERLAFIEDAILQRIGAPEYASGDEPKWQERIRKFGSEGMIP